MRRAIASFSATEYMEYLDSDFLPYILSSRKNSEPVNLNT